MEVDASHELATQQQQQRQQPQQQEPVQAVNQNDVHRTVAVPTLVAEGTSSAVVAPPRPGEEPMVM